MLQSLFDVSLRIVILQTNSQTTKHGEEKTFCSTSWLKRSKRSVSVQLSTRLDIFRTVCARVLFTSLEIVLNGRLEK